MDEDQNEEEIEQVQQDDNDDDRYTKVENDVYLIEGYDGGKNENEEQKEEVVEEVKTQISKEKPQKSDAKKEIKKFKIILLGEKGVGKSSLIDRYVSNKFSNFEGSGIKDAVQNKKYEVDKNLTADLSINDTSEVENLGKYPREYFNDSHGAILVFSLADHRSFERLSYWKEELESNAPRDVVICYLGNQADRTADRKVTVDEINELVGDNLYYDVSAKTGNNVSLAFEQLTIGIIEKQKEEVHNPEKVVRGKEGRKTMSLQDVKQPTKKKKKFC